MVALGESQVFKLSKLLQNAIIPQIENIQDLSKQMILHKEVCLALTALFSHRIIWEQFEDYWHSESVTQLDLSNYLKNRSIAHDHRSAINQVAKIFVRRL